MVEGTLGGGPLVVVGGKKLVIGVQPLAREVFVGLGGSVSPECFRLLMISLLLRLVCVASPESRPRLLLRCEEHDG